MKILFVTSEAAPFAKTGGLGDVAGALPAAITGGTDEVRVILPLYASVSDEWRLKMRFVKHTYVPLAWRNLYCGLFELTENGVTTYFIDNEYYFKRGDIYGHYDDGERYAYFSRAVTALLTDLEGWVPNVVHCNDWETALVPIYMRTLYRGDPVIDGMKTVFTIHNIEYQGRFARDTLENLFGLPADIFNKGTLEFRSGVNLMKGAIEMSDRVTTVSPTYAGELTDPFYANGLEGVIKANSGKLSGILNGIDTVLHNPETDESLTRRYTFATIEDKAACKAELQKILGLAINPGVPLIVSVGRLAGHKGIDLIADALDEMLDMEVQFALLGRGDWHFEQVLSAAQHRYEGRVSVSLTYNPALSNAFYAGGDMFLMPSRAEPCGLSQMIAMRYGTVPIVRETGGLRDTVEPFNPETGGGMGFTFRNYDKGDMLYAIRRAVDLYHKDKTRWSAVQERDMGRDFGWADSAEAYRKLYNEAFS
ncbi:MAG: glycogen synthase GlgA [Oscillospiraceae bacterium]|jgi:starch synthase|nr:glycogen synthase GlgA [Oscillospiraceae bacterium]